MIDENLGCFCGGWYTSDEMDHGVCGKELGGDAMNVLKSYGSESVSSLMEIMHSVRPNRAEQAFIT